MLLKIGQQTELFDMIKPPLHNANLCSFWYHVCKNLFDFDDENTLKLSFYQKC